MTAPTIVHRTSDGREFEDLAEAEAHQALLNKVERFMDDEQVGDSRRRRLRDMLIRWTERHENTVTTLSGVQE